MKTKNDFPFYSTLKTFLLIGCDSFAYFFSLFLAVKIRELLPILFKSLEFPGFYIGAYINAEILFFLGILIVVFIWNSLYQTRRSFWEELLIIWQSLLVSCLLSYLFLFNFSDLFPIISRIVVFLLFAVMIVVVPLFRFVVKKILFSLYFWRTPMIISCQPNEISRAEKIADIFNKDFYLGFVPVGVLVEKGESSLQVYRDKKDLPKKIAVFMLGDQQQNSKLLSYFYSRYRKIYLIPDVGSYSSEGAEYIFTERLFLQKIENKLNSYFSQFTKTTMDFVFGFAIVIVLSPMFLVIAMLIFVNSPGSVFYRHTRVGRNGKEFKMWKFRTMYKDADKKLKEILDKDPELKKEWDTYFKLKNDPRIIPVGRFLRKYSLDEFPQLFNVLSGEMSLVGPRPFIKGEIKDEDLLPLYEQVKPGLTGLWQVSGRNQIDRLDRTNIDVWYIQHWSLSLDLLILLNTPVAVLSAKGAS